MQKILIVKTSAFGDVIHAFSVVSYLKERFPDSEIDWVVEEQCAELVRAHPLINRTLAVKTRSWRKSLFSKNTWQEIKTFRHTLRECEYDYVFDLQGNSKSALLTLQVRSKQKVGFGKKTVPEWPNLLSTHFRYNPPEGINVREALLYVVQTHFDDATRFIPNNVTLKTSQSQQEYVDQLISQLKRPIVMVCPGSAWANKQLSEETLHALLQKVQKEKNCHFLFAWGSREEQLWATQLHDQFIESSTLLEKMSLPTLQNLMQKVSLVIAMDSLPLHLAGTTLTPTFSVFGPSLAKIYQPIGEQHRSIQASCPYGRHFERRCPILRTCPTGACMKNLSIDEITFSDEIR